MSLLDKMKDACVMMVKTSVSDGMGGFIVSWVDGASFDAVIRKDSAPEIRVAEQQGVDEQFTVIVSKSTTLAFGDVFKRVSDGAIFRMTSNTLDAAAPGVSSVQIAKGTAERWVLA